MHESSTTRPKQILEEMWDLIGGHGHKTHTSSVPVAIPTPNRSSLSIPHGHGHARSSSVPPAPGRSAATAHSHSHSRSQSHTPIPLPMPNAGSGSRALTPQPQSRGLFPPSKPKHQVVHPQPPPHHQHAQQQVAVHGTHRQQQQQQVIHGNDQQQPPPMHHHQQQQQQVGVHGTHRQPQQQQVIHGNDQQQPLRMHHPQQQQQVFHEHDQQQPPPMRHHQHQQQVGVHGTHRQPQQQANHGNEQQQPPPMYHYQQQQQTVVNGAHRQPQQQQVIHGHDQQLEQPPPMRHRQQQQQAVVNGAHRQPQQQQVIHGHDQQQPPPMRHRQQQQQQPPPMHHRQQQHQQPQQMPMQMPAPHPDFMYSRCTGRRRALCIGINYRGQSHELKGCINDAKDNFSFLVRHAKYRPEDIVVLTDDCPHTRGQPTRENMLDGMRWLVRGAQPHDALFFHYSGHGGQTPEQKRQNGDKVDGLDDVIYPVDYQRAGSIVDDDMHDIMVNPLPPGCRLTAIFDSCHSGTVLDLPFAYDHHGRLKAPQVTWKWIKRRSTPADVILLSGCKDGQTSADTFEDGEAVGAASHAFIKAVEMRPNQSYKEILQNIRAILQPKFSQKPQLGSSHPINTSRKFIM